jgi:hypothetical protein
VLLAEAISVPRGWGGMVRRAVRLDREDHLARTIRMERGEVDPVPRDADLRLQRDAGASEVVVDVALEGVHAPVARRRVCETLSAGFDVGQVRGEHAHALRLQTARVEVRRRE